MKPFALPLALLLAAPALAEPVSCSFAEECYSTMACEATDYEIEVDLEAGTVSDLTGNFEVALSAEGPGWHQVVYDAWGSYNTLTMGATRWILSVHIGTAPAVINYYGDCGEQ